MIIVPNDVKCGFCRRQFCCSKCRVSHEEKNHFDEMAAKKSDERLRSTCYICNELKFPFGTFFQFLTDEMMTHIITNHLPLKCDRCSLIFETAEDFENVEKCCQPKFSTEKLVEQREYQNREANTDQDERSELATKLLEIPDTVNKGVTPLNTINMRWRRKSKEAFKADSQVLTEEEKRRQTSTPTVGNFTTTTHFTDSTSIHLSSINYTSSPSSDSGELSPPIPPPAAPKEIPVPKTPSSLQNIRSVNRSRTKPLMQPTPLQQVMTKSIQRAYQQHGHYRQTPFAMQKRRVSFNSTSSSSEASLLKPYFNPGSPLDLRLSPALKRLGNMQSTQAAKSSQQTEDCPGNSSDMILSRHVEFEQIQVIFSRGKISSESAAISSYQACYTDQVQSGSVPDIDFTPKIVGSNMLKKAISFEPPNTVDKTPAFLFSNALKESRQNMFHGDEDDNDNDYDEDSDVFYTPRSTPIKPRFVKESTSSELIDQLENCDKAENSKESEDSKPRNLWNFVSNVIKIAARKSEDIGETLSSGDNIWNFKQPGFVKNAVDYFTKRSNELNEQDQTLKRRRVSSGTENKVTSNTAPAVKRQKIQPRKPLDRMRKLS